MELVLLLRPSDSIGRARQAAVQSSVEASVHSNLFLARTHPFDFPVWAEWNADLLEKGAFMSVLDTLYSSSAET